MKNQELPHYEGVVVVRDFRNLEKPKKVQFVTFSSYQNYMINFYNV